MSTKSGWEQKEGK